MGQVINTNSLSLLTQNNLTKSQGALNTAIERLSSGMRINSAKDDAAGMAIANRFTATIKGLTQASRNANDGISLAQTTEGALSEVNSNLQRIRELTVQSANGSNSTADRISIQDEIIQRLAEIDRTSAQTDFNGVKVLASNSRLTVQVGSNDAERIEINLKQMDSTTLGLSGFSVAANSLSVGAALTQVPGATGAAPATVTYNASVLTSLNAANPSAGFTAADLSLRNVLSSSGAPTANYVVKAGDDFFAASVNTSGVVTLNTSQGTFTDTANGVTATVAFTGSLIKVATNTSGATAGFITLQGRNYASDAPAIVNNGAGGGVSTTGAVILSGASATTQFVGAATNKPLEKIDAALKLVDSLRGSLGAVQNRFDSVISNLGTTINNLTSSRSRIEDADYAVEVSNMSRAQILQQAGTSVLAQANQTTQGVLSLLR